jgi:uncharacterized protein YneF (UPF0154 family)
MDPKVLLLFALLMPILMLAAGMFVARKQDKEAARSQPPATSEVSGWKTS